VTGPTADALVLVGLRGAGKSTVGRRVAERLGRPFVDLDCVVEGNAGVTIRSLFAEQGERAFRDLEGSALAETLRLVPRAVVATGGGVVLRAENRAALAGTFVVYLAGSPEVLAARVAADPSSADGRPALADGGPLVEATKLLAVRDPLYREVASVVVDVQRSVSEVLEAVLVALKTIPQ
jgi:shikimate kinase